ncbi:MAG: hypothetical protein COW13_02640 [Candidatus Omnitrophica bacterium CG12_big_fil_rev_8_21_14_0_65_50_5]|nr:MAG: hypothetical protein COW13_02640 [Candidatus Omnitrophica bacterium CG12_big_fil_rev_8_21_14_0_65_50_5]
MIMKIREKGQITIPSKIRTALHLSKDSILSVAKIGDAIVLSSQPPQFSEASQKFSRQAKKNNISLDELLGDLKTLRKK